MTAVDQPNPLEAGFSTFVDAARRLEVSYAELRERAEAIDLELGVANRDLASALAEREAVFAALPVGVISCSADGSTRVRNPEAERLLQVAAEVGEDLKALPAGEHTVGDASLRVQRVPLPGRDGSLLVVEDRSRVVALEHEVDRLDRLAGLSELALGIAHEIKNPLNGIMGFASLMERYDDPDALKRCAKNVVAGMHQVDEIVRSMLAFAQPRDGQLVPRPLKDVVESACAESSVPRDVVQVRGGGEGGAGNLAATALVDAPTLTRVLSNLFRNSVEAGASKVWAHVTRVSSRLVIDVVDNGRGVDPKVSGRVFELFVSTKESENGARSGGRGLGLAMVARILSFVGGSIELCSHREGSDEDGEVRGGAHFRVTTPWIEGMAASVAADAALSARGADA